MVTIGCLLARITYTASIQENYRFVTLPGLGAALQSASGRRDGPRRGDAVVAPRANESGVPAAGSRLARCGLQWQRQRPRLDREPAWLDHDGREAAAPAGPRRRRCRTGPTTSFYGSRAQMGRRTDIRLAGTEPKTEQRLRTPVRE